MSSAVDAEMTLKNMMDSLKIAGNAGLIASDMKKPVLAELNYFNVDRRTGARAADDLDNAHQTEDLGKMFERQKDLIKEQKMKKEFRDKLPENEKQDGEKAIAQDSKPKWRVVDTDVLHKQRLEADLDLIGKISDAVVVIAKATEVRERREATDKVSLDERLTMIEERIRELEMTEAFHRFHNQDSSPRAVVSRDPANGENGQGTQKVMDPQVARKTSMDASSPTDAVLAAHLDSRYEEMVSQDARMLAWNHHHEKRILRTGGFGKETRLVPDVYDLCTELTAERMAHLGRMNKGKWTREEQAAAQSADAKKFGAAVVDYSAEIAAQDPLGGWNF